MKQRLGAFGHTRPLLFDLRFQMLLVTQDVALPLRDRLILTNPDFLSHLKEDIDYRAVFN